ncbi:MAG: hypothetical protein FJ254_01065 [Phycisphaerae bacterium]|nr:hypothetical protein [Phycisphaerae bacterium]
MTHFTQRATSSIMSGFGILVAVGIAALAVSLPGCSLLTSRPGSTQWTISIDGSSPTTEGTPMLGQLGVGRPRIAAPWNSGTLIYRFADGEARADIYNGWVMPLDQILQAQMVDALAHSKVATSVTSAGLYGSDELSLVSSVRTFGAFFGTDRKGVTRVTLHALLLQRTDVDPRLIMDRTYEHESPVASDDAAGVIKGLSDAFGQCLGDLARDLRALPADALAKP